jgi:hypothetical protein
MRDTGPPSRRPGTGPFRARAWLLVGLAATVGVALGIGGFTFRYAEGLSYLSADPRACVNCHIMRPEYDAWQKASHHTTAVCVETAWASALLRRPRGSWRRRSTTRARASSHCSVFCPQGPWWGQRRPHRHLALRVRARLGCPRRPRLRAPRPRDGDALELLPPLRALLHTRADRQRPPRSRKAGFDVQLKGPDAAFTGKAQTHGAGRPPRRGRHHDRRRSFLGL